MENKERKIRVSSYGGNEHSVNIVDFTGQELEKMLGSMENGTYWVKVENGRLITVPSFEELPSPVKDEEMLPFWRKATSSEMKNCYTLFETEPIEEVSSNSSISIQHLCGFNYSKENYRYEAEKLESYGFKCLRSKRDMEGRYSEIWRLSSLIFARGELKNFIEVSKDDKKKLKMAVSFLSRNLSFGTLDVSILKLAARLDY